MLKNAIPFNMYVYPCCSAAANPRGSALDAVSPVIQQFAQQGTIPGSIAQSAARAQIFAYSV
jgi:hypothetical protein